MVFSRSMVKKVKVNVQTPLKLALPLSYNLEQNKTTLNRKSGCGYTCVAKGADHERCVVVLKTGCIIERFSNDCRKNKIKAITPTNHNRSKQRDEPIKVPSNYL